MYRVRKIWSLPGALILLAGGAGAATAPSYGDLLGATKAADWRDTDPANTLYLDIPGGRVVIEMSPAFAPEHVQNIKRLVQEHYYDALSIVRVQDNYVVQWGDPDNRHATPSSARIVPPEFDQPLQPAVPFTRLPDGDVYAPQVGFSNGMPAARDPRDKRMWLAHCYGMVGVGRDVDPGSGSGAELYVVIGHAPRHLDRNVALVGRVLKGMELLASLPRGAAAMGFYDKPGEPVKIARVRLEADLPAAEREHLQVIRTDTATFAALVESRRNRKDSWYVRPAGHIDLCNVPLAVRQTPAAAAAPAAH